MSKTHEILLSQGWDDFKNRRQFGNQYYNEFIKKLNPFLIAYYEQYETLLRVGNELRESQEKLAHYKSRYEEIAGITSKMKSDLKAVGVMEGSYRA